MSEEQQALETSVTEEPKQEETKPEASTYDDINYMLVQYQALLDRSLKLMPLVSSNGLRRLFIAYLKAGVHEIPNLQDKIEKDLFKSIMQLHDIKYSLIMKAIDDSSKQAKEELEAKEEKKETNDEQQ